MITRSKYQTDNYQNYVFMFFVFRLIIRAEGNPISITDHAIRHRVVKSHRLIVACRVFHSRQRWSEAVPNARDCVLARIDNTRRSSRAETNPSSYGTTHRSTPSAPPRPPVPTSLATGSSRGSQPPETRKPGTGKTGRGTPRRAAMNFVRYARAHIVEVLVLPCFLCYKPWWTFSNPKNIATGIFV